MQFKILGPLAVVVDGEEVQLAASKPRTLLVRLLVEANRTVPAERLVEDLWDGDPPRSAMQTLQTYVSTLRKLLGSDRLVTAAGGYRLDVRPGELDRDDFEAKLAARPLSKEVLQGALGLWRGPALGEAADAPWAAAEAARLEELRLGATETLLEVRLELGEHATVAAEAESLVAEHPLRERLWALLMTALYQSGRQADALRAFQRLRRHLGEELGIEPSRELQELEARMLRQEADLAPQPTAAPVRRVLPTGVVSFFLTDVVGSTRLWEAAPAAMADAVDRHEQMLRAIVEKHNGVLLKARGEGDSTFSVFQRATDALAAAVDAREQLHAADWSTPTPFEVRMAVHTGEAVERDGDYYGRSVNRAARLRGTAPTGQVVLSQATAELVVDDLPEGYRLSPLGVQELRDLERPETVYVVSAVGDQLAAAEPAADRIGLPARLAAAPQVGFFGRQAERERLDAALKLAANGTGRAVFLAGEPGIGKTALAGELARDAFAAGAIVLLGRCDEDLGVPYRPWVEAFTHLIEQAPADLLDSVPSRQLSDVARLVPAVLDRRPGAGASGRGDADGDRWALFAAVVALLNAAAATAPVVLLIDDLQWADKPSLLLLRHVIEHVRSQCVLVVGTYRDSELSADHPLTNTLADLRADASTERITLRGLGDGDVVEMIESLSGQTLEAEALALVHAVRRETDGNPFFATELLRHLAETGAVYLDDDGRWVPRADLDEAGLPDSVREVVGRRVRNVGTNVEQVLRVASVIGQEFDLSTLAAAAGIDEDSALNGIEAAVAANLLTNIAVGRFAFAHALVAHTLYADLTPTRRALLHRQVAEAIEAQSGAGARAAELARHWAAATAPDDVEKAVAYAQQAGDLAMRALAPDEAIRWYTQALELLTRDGHDESARGQLLLRLGRAQRDAGDSAHRATLLDAARIAQQRGDSDLLVRAALANSRGFVGTIDDTIKNRIEVLRAALAAAGPDDSAVRARLLGTLAAELRGVEDTSECQPLARESVAMARRVGDARLLAQVINLALFAIWNADTLDERLALSSEGMELCGALGDPALRHWVAQWRLHALAESGDIDGAEECVRTMLQVADDTGRPALQWAGRAYSASLHALRGELDAATALTAESNERAADIAATDARMIGVGVELVSSWHRGDMDAAARTLELHVNWMNDNVLRLTFARNFAAELAFARLAAAGGVAASPTTVGLAVVVGGDGTFARDLLDAAWTGQFWLGYLGGTALAALLAEMCVAVGTREQAARLYSVIETYHGQIASSGSYWLGSTAYYVAILAKQLGLTDEADQYFREAEEMNERIRAPFFLAQTRVAWARLLLDRQDRGDAERAAALLDSAFELATAHGCAGVLRDIEALRATPPPLPDRLRSERPLVGRDSELAKLDGDAALVLVGGEPGIGKSALVGAAAARSHTAGTGIFYGRCDEDLRVPYFPFVDALTQLVTNVPSSVLDAVGDRRLAELVRLVPSLADLRPLPAPQSTDPETERYLMMSAAIALLDEAARRSPVVLVVDDLHWADKPTVVLLRHILANVSGNVRVFATYRHTDLYADSPFADALPTLRSDPKTTHFVLSGLRADALAALTGADDELAAQLHRDTDGNPFFASELYRHRLAVGSTGTPENVRGLIRRRVAALGDDVRSVLTTASAIGQEFDLPLLQALAGDSIDLLGVLERAEAAALVETVSPRQFRFLHALIQQSLYDDVHPTRRASVHLDIARAIEQLGPSDERISELARHWMEAAVSPADIETAVDYATRAGDAAAAASGPDEAARWYKQALELQIRLPAPNDAERCRLLFCLATSQLHAGDPAFRQSRLACAEVAERIGDRDTLVSAALAENQFGMPSQFDESVRPLIERALRVVGDGRTPERARLLGRLGNQLMFSESDRGWALFAEAIDLAREAGDASALADVYALHGSWQRSNLLERRAELAEAMALAEQVDDPALLFMAIQHAYLAASQAGARVEADELLDRAWDIAHRIGRPDFRWLTMWVRADQLLLHGRLEESEALVEAAYALACEGEQIGREAIYAAGIAALRWHQGRHAETQPIVDDAARVTPDLAIMRIPVTVAADGQPGDLRALVTSLPKDGSWALMGVILADIIARLDDREAAALLYDDLVPYREQWAFGGPVNRGPVPHALGVLARLLGEIEAAEAHFAAAAKTSEAMEAPFFLARAHLEWARLLLERDRDGDAARALEMLRDAHAAAQQYGYMQVERRAQRLLDSPR